jgi:dTDP-4-amino-4,6-dideoxygalactose transaminase
MTEVSAAMGLTSLESLDDFIATNRSHYSQYRTSLSGIRGLRLLQPGPDVTSNCHYVVVEIDDRACGLKRDTLLRVLHAENVLARRYFYPGCHRVEPYKHHFSDTLPNTERLTDRVLVLPTGTALTTGDVDRICQCIRIAMQHGREVEQLAAASASGPAFR